MAVDQQVFRRVMSNFASGVTVLATRAEGRFYGMTASAITSVSLEPILVLACVERATLAHGYLERSGEFVLSVLSEEQRQLSQLFAQDESAPARYFADIAYQPAGSGLPVLSGALAYLDCAVVAAHPGGDHTIYVGEVREAAVLRPDSRPLLYFRSDYHRLRD